MDDDQIETIEFKLLLDALFQRWGYDFRSYASASIGRRGRQFLISSKFQSFGEIIPELMRNRELFSEIVKNFSIQVTDFFRDPYVYSVIRKEVVSLLKTWPHIKIWHAGCATGEEVYSLAIVLKEEGIYDRTTIYATDFNDDAIKFAKDGIYDSNKFTDATQSYHLAGGKYNFSKYYYARYDAVSLNSDLRERIVFSNHNLVTDSVFGEMHLIFCRNVLIYFNRNLQNRVLSILDNSLVRGGFLCLGTKETLEFSDVYQNFDVVNDNAKIYKKRSSL